MNKESKELYGVIGDVEKFQPYRTDLAISEFILTNEEDNKEWTVLAPSGTIHWYFDDEQKHYYVRGIILNESTILATYVDRWGRYCDHCGKHHTEGWYIGEWEYACSDECAYALCGGEQAFRESILLDEDGELHEDSATYWTEWE